MALSGSEDTIRARYETYHHRSQFEKIVLNVFMLFETVPGLLYLRKLVTINGSAMSQNFARSAVKTSRSVFGACIQHELKVYNVLCQFQFINR